MTAHAMPREASFRVETALGDTETEADWPGNGTEIYVIEPDITGVERQVLENTNISEARLNPHQSILGLKSEAAYSHGIYLTAKGTSAADTAQATASGLMTILKSAVGGLDLGYRDGLSGGSAAAPEVDADSGTYVAGDWGFFYDDSAGTGEFGRIESKAALALTLFWSLGFTPGASDVMYAVADVFPNEPALNNHDDADHTTLGWFVQGEHAEDAFELWGCKPALGDITVTAGEPVAPTLSYIVTSYENTPSKVTFNTTPSGVAPTVPGTGTTCTIKMGDLAGALASVDARGSLVFKNGITWAKVQGPNGLEGNHGYVCTGVQALLELTVEYDNAYLTKFHAGTLQHVMIQVGNTPTTAWGIYIPRAEFFVEPKRDAEGDVTSSKLVLRCLKDTASVTGLSGNDIDKRKAPWHLLFTA